MKKQIIGRTLLPRLQKFAQTFPAIALLGPRQSGKTTLAKLAFPKHRYVNLEGIDEQHEATIDARGFLKSLANPHGIILDEIQNVPDLPREIQKMSDANEQPGYYILTGSHNYLLNEKISQSLAGRVSIQTLLPFTVNELGQANKLPDDVFDLVYKGMYPRIHNDGFDPDQWYASYINTFVQRDVRMIKNIENLSAFTRFISLCAGRVGQVLNLTSLSIDSDVSVNTIRSWLSILESSYILYLLQPYYKNFSKRLIKSPKLYFYDTGLACNLLRIKSTAQLMDHYLQGGLFESFIMSELHKEFYHRSMQPPLYYWRDKAGREIDCILEGASRLTPIEIKASQTRAPRNLTGLEYWYKMTKSPEKNGIVIYGGEETRKLTESHHMSWRSLYQIVEQNI